MSRTAAEAWRYPGRHFAETLSLLVAHRGLEAERELIDILGRDRLLSIYGGQEPRFGEFLEISRVLQVPLSTFQIFEPKSFPELEIAFAEVLYHAAKLSGAERASLAEEISALALDVAGRKNPQAPLPESLLAALKRNGGS